MPIIQSTHKVNDQEIEINIEVDKVPEPDSPYKDLRDSKTEKIIKATRDIFDDGMELARSCAACAVDSFNKIGQEIRPDEFEIQLAIKLDAEVGAILAKMGTEAQMQVRMKWGKQNVGTQLNQNGNGSADTGQNEMG